MWYVRPAKPQISLRIYLCLWYVLPAKPQISLCISLCLLLEYSMSVKQLTEHHLEVLSLKGDRTGSSESIFVKMPQCTSFEIMCRVSYIIEYFSYLYHLSENVSC